jgi:hypothetical protein
MDHRVKEGHQAQGGHDVKAGHHARRVNDECCEHKRR